MAMIPPVVASGPVIRYGIVGMCCLAMLWFGGCGDSPSDPRQNEVNGAIKDLASEQGPDRRRAVVALERLLPPAAKAQGVDAKAIASLRGLVADDRDDHVRAAAIRVLGKTRDNQAWDLIVQRMQADEVQVRNEVLQALASIDAARAAPLLVQALTDAQPTVRLIAASALASSEGGVKELVSRLDNMAVDQQALVNGLDSSALPAAAQVLVNGIASTNPLLRSAGIRKAGAIRHQASVPVLAEILGRDRRTGISEDDRKAAAQSLVAIGGDEALTAVLRISTGAGHWADELLADRQAELRPLLVSLAKSGSDRKVPLPTLVHYLLRETSVECVVALADLATPELPELGRVCERLHHHASAEVRAKVAARLRQVLDRKHPRLRELLGSLAMVGQPGDGPDASAVFGILKMVFDEYQVMKTAGYANPLKEGVVETPEQSKNRQLCQAQGDLLCLAADACSRLKVTAAAPIFADLMKNDFVVPGVIGALALGDPASLDLVNQTLLTTKIHPWSFVTDTCGTMLRKCRDPRILPGLVAMMPRGERGRIYEIIAANGTPEAAAILMGELADPSIPKEKKKNNIAHLMPKLGAAGRPQFIKAMIDSPQPVKPGDPDLGWWCAEFLREQRQAAAPDILKAFSTKRPSGMVAFRFIRALDLADTPDAIAAQASWLTDADRDLADVALKSLVRNRRLGALPAIRAAHAAAPPGGWQNMLALAIKDLTAPVMDNSQ